MRLEWRKVSPYCLDAGSHTVARVYTVGVDGRHKWRYESHRREPDPRSPDGFSHERSTRLGIFDDSASARGACETDAAATAIRGKRGDKEPRGAGGAGTRDSGA